MATSAKPTDDTTSDDTTAEESRTDEERRTGEEARTDDEQDVLIHLDAPAEATGTLGQDLLRGAVGGLVAGAVFIGVTAWFATTTGGSLFDPFRMISTIVLGGEPAEVGQAGILTGAAIHVGLSLLFGLLFAVAAPFLRRHDSLVSIGIAYGGALYVVNFLVFGQEFYPQFQEANQAFELTAHLLFGALLGATFASMRLPGELRRNIVGQRAARIVGALSAAVAAFVHLALANQYLGDELYVGAVVVAAAIALTYAAVQLARRADLAAWVVGVLVSAGMITAYVLARTTGLPSVDGAGGALGIAAVVAEGVFLVAFVGALVGRRRNRTRIRKVPRRRPTRADMSAKEATTER